MTTYLTRTGVGTQYTSTLPNGDHLTVYPDCSAERVRFVDRKIWDRPRAARGCLQCCNPRVVCPNPDHQPREYLTKDTILVARFSRQKSVADVLKLAAPGVDFGVMTDGSFPVRAYMPYTEDQIRAYPRIKNDILDGVT
jgi:hypothetical protein